jgi:prepilin-type N-terminal cleavage/methylation domain-containing protein
MTTRTNIGNIRRQRGLSLVELMIAMTLALILTAAVVSVFASNRHSFTQDQNVQRMQDDARHALRELTFDLSMAGHYADLLVPGSVTLDGGLTLTADCGPVGAPEWMYQTVEAGTGNSLSVVALDNATAAQAAANFSCIGGGEFLDGTDVVSIKRVAGARVAAPTAGRVYLRTNGTVGLLYKEPTGAPAINVPAPRAEWEYRPSIYYIRNFAYEAGDGIPTLCKKVLRGNQPGMTTECLAAGIEDMQIEYGIDVNGDGFANVYMPSPTVAEMQNVVSARVALLARTTEIDTRYENDKTYTLSNADAYAPADSFHRRVVSMTVGIQNIRSLNAMGL